HLGAALGTVPTLVPFQPPETLTEVILARTFREKVRRFTDEYLISRSGTQPVPFGGRDIELQRLDAWLHDPQSNPLMLVTAPAGRGKSALLVQWVKSLQDRGVCGEDRWQLAFVPISTRAETNLPGVFYEGLARRLAEIVGRPLQSHAFLDSDGFRFAVPDLLAEVGKSNKQRVLIVVDGIDEAPENRFDAGIFPKAPPSNLRILLSARWQVGDHDSEGWLKRLDWKQGARVASFDLDPLDTARIADVLVKLGAPADELANDRALVRRLAVLTLGEPLLVRFYAEDLWSLSIKGPRV